MTSLRSSRSLSNLQVNSLRFNQQDLPANGGILTVGTTGAVIVSSAITLASIDVSSIVVADLSAANFDVSGIATTTITVSSLTADTAVFTGDITAQDVYVFGAIQALDVSARYFDISGLKVGENLDVSGTLRVDLSSSFVGTATFLSAVDASGQSATVGSLTVQTIVDASSLSVSGGTTVQDLSAASLSVSGGTTLQDLSAASLSVSGGTTVQDLSAASLSVSGGTTVQDLSAASLYVSGGTTVQDLSAASLSVAGPATFNTATMDTLTVRDIYIQNQIVDVSLGYATHLLIDNILAGSGGATIYSFDPQYSLDVSGGLRVGNLSGTHLRITPGLTGWTTLEPVGAPGAGISISGDLSANLLTAFGISASEGVTAGSIYSYGSITTPGNIYANDVSARTLDISGLSTDENVDISGALTVELNSLLKGGVTMWSNVDVSGSVVGRSGLRVLTPSSQSSGVATGTTVAAGYVDTNVLRIFVDGGGTGATLGQLQLPIGTGGRPNGAAFVWNNAGLDGGNGDAQLIIGTGGNTATGGKFNVYTGITQQAVPNGIQPQMSLDASGNLTIVGQLNANAIVSTTSITGSSAAITNALSVGTTTTTKSLTVTANSGYTRTANIDVTIQNAPSRNRLRIGTGLGAGNYSPLVSTDDIAIIFDQSGQETGSLVIGQWSGTARGIRISNDGLVYIGQDVQVPGGITVNGTLYAGGNFTAGSNAEIRGDLTVRAGAAINNSSSSTSTLILNNANGGNGSPQTLTVAMSGANGFLSDAILNTTKAGVADVPDIVFQTDGTERMRISGSGSNVTVTANGVSTLSGNYDLTVQNSPGYNQVRIGTNLTKTGNSPLVTDGDMGILYNRSGVNTGGNFVLGLQTGATGSAYGLRISDTGLVYIGQNVEVPGNLTVNGSIIGNIAYSVQTL